MDYPVVNAVTDPSDVLQWGFDLSPYPTPKTKPWLQADELVTALVMSSDAGVTVADETWGPNDTGVPGSRILAWVSGMALGTTAEVHYTYTTNLGRTTTRTIRFQCVSK